MNKKLTPKQEIFVKEYIIDFNGSRAARAAGYSKNSAQEIASENLSKPIIQQAIQRELEDRKERIEVSQDFVLKQLVKIAGADIKQFIEYDEDNNVIFKPYDSIDGEVVSEIGTTATAYGTNKKLKLHDKMKALELLGRHLGMYKDILNVKKEPETITSNELEELEQELQLEKEKESTKKEPKTNE